jgi:putative Holliday junction resolvase
MRFLGIDYGTKRVGLALGDETGTFAMPFAVWPNDSRLLTRLGELCRSRTVAKIVVGESKDLEGRPNKIMPAIEKFAEELVRVSGVPVEYEPELFTSAQAERGNGQVELDARAAALILQSYLDRTHEH